MVDAVRRDRVIVGPPGILTVWTFEVVKALVELSRSVRLRVLDRTDTIDGDAGPQDGLPFVYLTQYPGSSVIEAIREGRLSVLVVREPPLDALAFMQRMGNFSLKDALRSQTAA